MRIFLRTPGKQCFLRGVFSCALDDTFERKTHRRSSVPSVSLPFLWAFCLAANSARYFVEGYSVAASAVVIDAEIKKKAH